MLRSSISTLVLYINVVRIIKVKIRCCYQFYVNAGIVFSSREISRFIYLEMFIFHMLLRELLLYIFYSYHGQRKIIFVVHIVLMHVVCAVGDVTQFLSLFSLFHFSIFYHLSYREREVTYFLVIMVKIVAMVMIIWTKIYIDLKKAW